MSKQFFIGQHVYKLVPAADDQVRKVRGRVVRIQGETVRVCFSDYGREYQEWRLAADLGSATFGVMHEWSEWPEV